MTEISALNHQTPFYGANPGINLASSLTAFAITTIAATIFPTIGEAADISVPQYPILTFPKCYKPNCMGAVEPQHPIPVTPNCYTPDCPDLTESLLHPREKQAMEVIGRERSGYLFSPTFKEMQEYFRFSDVETNGCAPDAGRKRVLWLVADGTWNDFLNPARKASVLSDISKEYDLKYKVVNSFATLCEEIKQGAVMGSLTDVIIDANANSDSLYLRQAFGARIQEDFDFKQCFQPLSSDTNIVILPNAGAPDSYSGNELNNLAQKIANTANRKIIAATELVYPSRLKIDTLNPLKLKQLAVDSDRNLHKTFYPQCDKEKISSLKNPNCLCPPCADLLEKHIHDREKDAINTIISQTSSFFSSSPKFEKTQEYLRFRRDDPRQKVLFISAHGYDYDTEKTFDWLGYLSKQFDLKYTVSASYDEICREIKEAAKTGTLVDLIIHGHGNPEGLHLDKDEWIFKTGEDLEACFSGLDPSGTIFLHSCSTGARQKDAYDNLAQALADASKRTVVAATELSYPTRVKIISFDPLRASLESECDPGVNVYRIFQPRYVNCTSINWEDLQDRELAVMDALNDDLRMKGFSPFTPEWRKSQEYFRFCQDDPKKKLLYFSGKQDINGLLSPKHSIQFLRTLAEKFDLNFKSVASFDEMCAAIKSEEKSFSLENIIIQVPYLKDEERWVLTKEEDYVKDPNTDKMVKIVAENSFSSKGGYIKYSMFKGYNALIKELEVPSKETMASCFSGIEASGRIVFLSSHVGEAQGKNSYINTAQKVADATQKIVIAPMDISYPNLRNVSSINPLMVFHSKNGDQNINLYKTFYPKPK